jgi:hypothetical protein
VTPPLWREKILVTTLIIFVHCPARQQTTAVSPNCPNSLQRKGRGTKKYKKAEKDDFAKNFMKTKKL